jgi:AcrR family transcriptional regulator
MSDNAKPKPPRCTAQTGGGNRCQKAALEGTTRCRHHSFRIPGRPTKLNADLTEIIVSNVLEGVYMETAAQLAGINKTTLYRWLRKADDLEAAALEHVDEAKPKTHDLYQHIDPADWVYLDFRHAMKSAEAYSEAELLRKAASGKPGWQAQMTVLERRHPTRWRRRDSVEHSGGVDVRPVTHQPPAEKRDELIGTLRAAVPGMGPSSSTATKAKPKAKPKKRGAK